MMKKILFLIIGIVSLGMLAKAQDTTHIQPDISSFAAGAVPFTETAGDWAMVKDSTNATENWEKTNAVAINGDIVAQENWLVSNALATYEDVDGINDTVQSITFEYMFSNGNANATLDVYFIQDGTVDATTVIPANRINTYTLNVPGIYQPTLALPVSAAGLTTTAKVVFVYSTTAGGLDVDLFIDNVSTDTTTGFGAGDVYDQDFESGIAAANWTTVIGAGTEDFQDFNHVRMDDDDTFNQQAWLTSPSVYLEKVAYTDYELNISYYLKSNNAGDEGIQLAVITATDTVYEDLRGQGAGIYVDQVFDLEDFGPFGSEVNFEDSTVSFGIVFNSLAVNIEDFYLTSFTVSQDFDETSVQADAEVILTNFEELVNPSDIYDDDTTDLIGKAEGFWAVPPMNWSLAETSDATWERTALWGHDYVAYIDTFGTNGIALDESLASEVFDVNYPSTSADYVMSFQWLSQTNLQAGTNYDPAFGADVDYDFADIVVEIKTNEFDWTEVWWEDNEERLIATTVDNWTDFQTYLDDEGGAGWYTAQINLTEEGYVTENTTAIEVRINYTGMNDGADINSGWFAFDNLYIKQTELPDYSAKAVLPFTVNDIPAAESYDQIPYRQLSNPYLPGLMLTNYGDLSTAPVQIFAYLTTDDGAYTNEVIGFTEYVPNDNLGTVYVEIDSLQSLFYNQGGLVFDEGIEYTITFDSENDYITTDDDNNGTAEVLDETVVFDVTDLDYIKYNGVGAGMYTANESKGIGSLFEFWRHDVVASVSVWFNNPAANTKFNMQVIDSTSGEIVYTSPIKTAVNGENTFDFSNTEAGELDLEAGYYVFMFNQLSTTSLNVILDGEGNVYRRDIDGNLYIADAEANYGDIRMELNLKENTAPEFITAQPVKTLTAIAGKAFTFVVEGMDVDGDSLVWTYNDLPDWLDAWVTVDTTKTTITFSGTPTADDLGTFAYAIELEDEYGEAAQDFDPTPGFDNILDVTIEVVSQVATYAAPYSYDFAGTTLDINWTQIKDSSETGATSTWGINGDASIVDEAIAQDEWLISAPIYLPAGSGVEYTLSFDWTINDPDNFYGGTSVLGSGVDGDANFADLTVWLSDDNGQTWNTKLWKEDDKALVAASTEGIYSDERWGYDNTEHTSEFDLAMYAGDTILVAFQYESKNADGLVNVDIDDFKVEVNDEVNITLVAYTENPNIPQSLVDLNNGHDILLHFVDSGQRVPEGSMFTINVPSLGLYEENTLEAADFTDGLYVYPVNIPATKELATYAATCVLTLGEGFGSQTVNKSITIGTTTLDNSFVTGFDREMAGWHDGLGVYYTTVNDAELESISFDANTAGQDFAISIIQVVDENSTSGTEVARINDNTGIKLQTVNGNNTINIVDDEDFDMDDDGELDEPFILEAGTYVILIDPINETELNWGIDGSDLDYDLGHYVRGNYENLYTDSEEKDGALDISLSFKANEAPEFYADLDENDANDYNATNMVDYMQYDFDYSVVEGFAGSFEITVADDNALDALTYMQVIEPTNAMPWLSFDFATKVDTIIMNVANTAVAGSHMTWLWVYDGLDSAKFEVNLDVLTDDDFVLVDATPSEFEDDFNNGSVTNSDYDWNLVKGAKSTEDAVAWGYNPNWAAYIGTDATVGEYQDELLVLSHEDLFYFNAPVADTTYWLEVDFEIDGIENMTGMGALGSGNDDDGYNNADFRIFISDDLGATWDTLFHEDNQVLVEAADIDYPMEDNDEYTALIDITAYAGEKLLIAFGWEAVAEDVNRAELWIDNVRVYEMDPEVDLQIVNYNVLPKFVPVNQVSSFPVSMTVENQGTTASDTATIRAEVLFDGSDLIPAYEERASMASILADGSSDFNFTGVSDIDYEYQGTFSINYDIDQPYDGTVGAYSFTLTDEAYMYASGAQWWLDTETETGYGQVFTLNTADQLTHVLMDGGNDGDDVIVEIVQLAAEGETTGTIVYTSTSLTPDNNFVIVGGTWMDAVEIEPQNLEPGTYAVLVSDPDGDALEIYSQENVSDDYTASYIMGTSAEFEYIEEDTYTYIGLYFASQAPAFVDFAGDPVDLTELEAVVGVPFELTVRAIDEDEDDVPAILGELLPDWLTISTNGTGFETISGTPTALHIGDNNVEIHATDGINFVADVFTIEVMDNPAPEFTAFPEITAVVDVEYSYATTAIDPYGDAVTLAVTTVPAWITETIVDSSVTLVGTPTVDDLGNNLVKILATDSNGKTTEQIFDIYVYNNDAPEFVSEAPLAVSVGGSYLYFVKVSDGNDMDEITIDGTTLPTWLTLEGTSNGRATLFGTAPDENGTHDVLLTATDEAGASATQAFTIEVSGANTAPVFTSTEVLSATEDSPYRYDITATDADGDMLMFDAVVLPNWLVLTVTGNGVAHLQGVPTQGYVGTNDVVLTVTDGTASDMQEFVITVAEVNDPPMFNSPVVNEANVNELYVYNVEAWDEEGANLTFEAQLPEWLTFTETDNGVAVLEGIPEATNVGTEMITLQVSDGNTMVDQTFELTVTGAVGIENDEDAFISIYPNPSNGFVNISNAFESKIYIYNHVGELVDVIEKASHTEVIDLTGNPEGNYIMRIVTNDKVITKTVNIIK